MKKKLLILTLIIINLVILWAVLFAVDYMTVMNLGDPVIARHVEPEGGTFKGLGWTVEIEKRHDAEYGWVTEYVEMYLFGRLVGAAIT